MRKDPQAVRAFLLARSIENEALEKTEIPTVKSKGSYIFEYDQVYAIKRQDRSKS